MANGATPPSPPDVSSSSPAAAGSAVSAAPPPPPGSSRSFRLTTLALLYVSQALPLGFFVVAMPAILRAQGLSLEKVGLLSALGLPWLLKWAWAPLVDRFGARAGHYRSWLLPLQVAAVAVVGWISRLELGADGTPLLAAGALFMVLAATQDIATDGLAVRLVAAQERGLANGIQVGGYYLGQILGGGGAAWLVGRYGWGPAMLAMAAVLALGIPFVARLAEPVLAGEGAAATARPATVGYRALAAFFRRPGVGAWVLVLLTWRAAETMAQWMFNPMLVDQGYSLEQIGLLLGVVGSLGALAGASLGGALLGTLGRRRAMLGFGWLAALALVGYQVPARELGGLAAVLAVVVGMAAAGGMATAALYTAMMDRCRPATAATDFTLQQSLAAIGPLVASGASGASAAALGYAGHFALAVGVQLLVVVALARSRRLFAEETSDAPGVATASAAT
jgi:PAT family beta-lactamase induction signal transducer AmpG